MDIEEIKARLEQLGYDTSQADEDALIFAAQRTEERIKNICNQNKIPDGLEFRAVDMACGEFLAGELLFGGLSLYAEADGRLIKTVSEGDTTVTYQDGEDPVKRLENFIKELCGSDSEIIRWRKIVW